MPVYEYACRACGEVEEHLQPRAWTQSGLPREERHDHSH